jgi:hypothetical protein
MNMTTTTATPQPIMPTVLILTGMLSIVVGIVFLISAFFANLTIDKFKNNGVETTATMISLEKSGTRKAPVYTVGVVFKDTTGKKIKATTTDLITASQYQKFDKEFKWMDLAINPFDPQKDNQVKVLYLKEHPEEFVLKESTLPENQPPINRMDYALYLTGGGFAILMLQRFMNKKTPTA